jgi:hypothetical protein
MKLDDSQLTEGMQVKVVFNPETWPIHSAIYTYNGRDDEGYWLTRSDGWQRYLLRVDVQHLESL